MGNLSSTIENASQHGIMDYESALLPLHNIIQFPQFNFQVALLDNKPQEHTVKLMFTAAILIMCVPCDSIPTQVGNLQKLIKFRNI